MKVKYDIKKLSQLLSDFYNLTGITVSIITADMQGLPLCHIPHNNFCRLIQTSPEGRKRCNCSDSVLITTCRKSLKSESHICHAGLTDIASPVVKDTALLGYFLLGQILVNENTGDFASPMTFGIIADKVSDLGIDIDELKKAYSEIPVHKPDYIESAMSVVALLAKSVWLDDVVNIAEDEVFNEITGYIKNNLDKKLFVADITQRFFVSATYLYSRFHQYYHCTFNEYVSELRIKKSKELLADTLMSITDISALVGVNDRLYFSKLFKKHTKMTPTEYREALRNPENAVIISPIPNN